MRRRNRRSTTTKKEQSLCGSVRGWRDGGMVEEMVVEVAAVGAWVWAGSCREAPFLLRPAQRFIIPQPWVTGRGVSHRVWIFHSGSFLCLFALIPPESSTREFCFSSFTLQILDQMCCVWSSTTRTAHIWSLTGITTPALFFSTACLLTFTHYNTTLPTGTFIIKTYCPNTAEQLSENLDRKDRWGASSEDRQRKDRGLVVAALGHDGCEGLRKKQPLNSFTEASSIFMYQHFLPTNSLVYCAWSK